MDERSNVLLVSRSKEMLEQLEACLRERAGLRLERRQIVNGHADPLHGVTSVPDVLVLHLSQTWREELESLIERPAVQRLPLVVLGPAADMAVMRLAMQAGARDYLPLPLSRDDLLDVLDRIARERPASAEAPAGALTAVVNAKGGSGATLLASNLAHLMTTLRRRQVAVVDLDLQFGNLPLYLDLYPQRGVCEALTNLAELDAVALEGYMLRHASGLRVLGHSGEDALHVGEVAGHEIARLLDLICASHEQVVVDLPRRIDPLSVTVFERAAQVLVVVQQSVATVRDATRLLQILRRDVGVPRDRLNVVVNRYDRNAPVTIEDITRALNCGEPVRVPNDFSTASECVNSGTPIHDHARGSALDKALVALAAQMSGAAEAQRGGLLSRAFSGILKSRSSQWPAN